MSKTTQALPVKDIREDRVSVLVEVKGGRWRDGHSHLGSETIVSPSPNVFYLVLGRLDLYVDSGSVSRRLSHLDPTPDL